LERVTLRQGEALGAVEDRRQQLVEAGKGELHLRLHAARS
jgi:hypothetical protein